MSINDDEYPLHKAVYMNDVQTLKDIKDKCDLSQKDKHGNTALHLAVILGHKECIKILIDQDAPIKIKNFQGWTPLAEAISYGDRQTIVTLLSTLKKQSSNSMKTRRPHLIKALNDIPNFYMEIKWDFQSWLPFVSRSLPSDVSKIYKKGCNIRLDSTLSGFDDFKWEHGNISFLFLGDHKIGRSFVFMDNQEKYYQKIKKDFKTNVEDEVDLLMSNDIVALQLSTKEIAFHRAHSGWVFKEKRTELINGQFLADFYSISGLCLESKKRREHLTEEDLIENSSILKSFSKPDLKKSNSVETSSNSISDSTTNSNSNLIESEELDSKTVRRKSLPRPPATNLTWYDYINSDKQPCLGRKQVCKDNVKRFKATLGMSQNFPLTTSSLLDILEALAEFKHFNKLKEFIEVKLPPGFPIDICIPILPTITAHITFQEFRYEDNLDDNLFKIPDEYEKMRSDTF